MKTNRKPRKGLFNRFHLSVSDRDEDLVEVDLRGVCVACPMCGITMIYDGNSKLFCPDCGIKEK